MPQHLEVAIARGTAGFHVFLLHHLLGGPARNACDGRDSRDAERHHQAVQAGADHGGDRQTEQDGRERQQHVDEAHQRRVESPVVGGQQTERGADAAAHGDGGEAQHQRRAQAEQQAAHHVAALLIGAQQHLRAAPVADLAEPHAQVARIGIAGRDPGREEGRHDDREQESSGQRGNRISQDPAPGLPGNMRIARLVDLDGDLAHERAVPIRGSSQA